jgi:hypothetical protein
MWGTLSASIPVSGERPADLDEIAARVRAVLDDEVVSGSCA